MTEFLEAAGNGDIERVEQLLADGANYLERDSLGFTALLKSAYFGQKAMFEYLLDKGLGTLSEQTSFGENAVLTCAYQGHLSMMHWLLTDAGASLPEGKKARLNVWRQLKIADADDAVLTSLLKIMIMLDDAPRNFIARLLPHHADIVTRGQQLREQLPLHLESQRVLVDAHCPLPAVIHSIVIEYAVTTIDEMWENGLGVPTPASAPPKPKRKAPVRTTWHKKKKT